MKLGVKVIHCSERDTQITDQPKQVDEFVNTWSIEGFREEGTTTAEMGWGTHEKELPPLRLRAPGRPEEPDLPGADGHEHLGALVGAQLYIRGMVVRHGEAFTISDKLTVWEGGKAVYRPDGALRLLPVRRGDRLAATSCAATTTSCSRKLRIMNDEITERRPTSSARCSWATPTTRGGCGSDLEHRGVAPAGAASERDDDAGGDLRRRGVDVDDRESRAQGVCVPDDLPHDYILEIAKPYLGKFISTPSDWTPLKDYANVFDGLQQAASSTRPIRGSSRTSWSGDRD